MKTILLVDDDRGFVEKLETLLADACYRPRVLYGGVGVYETVTEIKPDFVILDSRLPGESGESIIHRIRKSKMRDQPPIIMISAHHGTRKPAMAAGADEFLAKPFAIDELLAAIEKQLARS